MIQNKTKINGTILAFLIIFITSSILFWDKNFFSAANFINILVKAAKNGGFLALGMAFVIISGEIDLSLGAVFALSGVVFAKFGAYHPLLGLIAGMMVGLISAYLIAFMVTKMKISSWIASISMMFALRGIALLTASASIPLKDASLMFASKKIFPGIFGLKSGISILIPIFFLLTYLCSVLASKSKFGMRLYAVGGHQEAAKMMGIDNDRIKTIAYLISGSIASFSGILLASSSGSATLRAGEAYETFAIAMCAIGGIKLSGGQGKISGVFFGILTYFLINTIFTYLPSQISVHWQNVIMGLLVIVSVASQSEIFHEWKKKIPFIRSQTD